MLSEMGENILCSLWIHLEVHVVGLSTSTFYTMSIASLKMNEVCACSNILTLQCQKCFRQGPASRRAALVSLWPGLSTALMDEVGALLNRAGTGFSPNTQMRFAWHNVFLEGAAWWGVSMRRRTWLLVLEFHGVNIGQNQNAPVSISVVLLNTALFVTDILMVSY